MDKTFCPHRFVNNSGIDCCKNSSNDEVTVCSQGCPKYFELSFGVHIGCKIGDDAVAASENHIG